MAEARKTTAKKEEAKTEEVKPKTSEKKAEEGIYGGLVTPNNPPKSEVVPESK